MEGLKNELTGVLEEATRSGAITSVTSLARLEEAVIYFLFHLVTEQVHVAPYQQTKRPILFIHLSNPRFEIPKRHPTPIRNLRSLPLRLRIRRRMHLTVMQAPVPQEVHQPVAKVEKKLPHVQEGG